VNRDGRAGVVWHTQGSGKSMEMELYVHLAGQRPELRNPTFVVVTDRTELDSQLFAGFARSLLLAEDPVAVTSRAQLRAELAQRTTGGILFTTLQKFGRTRAERESGADIRCCLNGATSSSSRTRRTAATMTTWTAMRGTSATPCRTPHSSPSPVRRSRSTTATRRMSSGR
jgi:type I site-specific restriction-modification system R (restriction) subunit